MDTTNRFVNSERVLLPHLTLKDSAERLIFRSLLEGSMKPGEVYSANSLAKELEISNSPVREAMMSLSDRGLLEPVRNRGFRVVELSPADRTEVYDLRMLIEVEAVRRAARLKLSPETADKLRELAQATVDSLPGEGDSHVVEYLEADHEFHLFMVDLVGNSRWSWMVRWLRDQSRINGVYAHLEDSSIASETAAEHLAIADAVISRDVELAVSLMQRHLSYAHPGEV